MKVESITPITWTYSEKTFPCLICHVRDAKKHVTIVEDETIIRIATCEKCAEYIDRYPTWLEETRLVNRLRFAEAI